jgi:hypothetical protein
MARKNEDKNTSTVVKVTVPAQPGIAIRDIEEAAKRGGRDSVPAEINMNVCQYELVGSKKSGDERTYDVKISWGPDVVSEDLDVADDDDDRIKAIISPPTGSEPGA